MKGKKDIKKGADERLPQEKLPHHANVLKCKGQKNNRAEPGEESKKNGTSPA